MIIQQRQYRCRIYLQRMDLLMCNTGPQDIGFGPNPTKLHLLPKPSMFMGMFASLRLREGSLLTIFIPTKHHRIELLTLCLW